MRKKSIRILALLMSFVMLISASCVTTFAYKTDYDEPQIDENGKTYFTYEQGGTWLMDTLDNLLGTISNGEPIVDVKVLGIEIYIDLGSYDLLCSSIKTTWGDIGGLAGLVGDLDELSVNALNNAAKRDDVRNPDYHCLYTLVQFLYENRSVLRKIVNYTFDYGVLDAGIIKPFNNGQTFVDSIGDGLLKDIGLFLRKTLYGLLEGLTGREEGTAFTDTTYPADGQDVDGALQDLVNWLLEDSLNLTIARDKVNLTDNTFYQLVSNLIEALLNSLVVPLLTDVLVDAFDIEVTDEYPKGIPGSENDTMGMVLPIVQGLMDKAESFPDYSSCEYPVEQIETLLTWFFVDGGMKQYINISPDGISIEDDFVDLLNRLCRLAIPLLHSLDGFDYLPSSYLPSDTELNIEEGQPGFITNATCYAQIVNVLLSGLFMGYYCRPEADSISAVGAYALASLCARVAPELNYLDMLDANYIDNGFTAMPMIAEYTAKGQYANGSTWTEVTRTYSIPYAAVDMGVTIGKYFLDGLITADFDAVPDSVADLNSTNTASATVRLEKFLKVLIDWALQKYAPLFDSALSLSAKYTTPADCWKELDEVLFSLIPSSWMPATITDHTMQAGVNTALGLNGSAAVPMNSILDLICGWLLGSVMDFDLQELFGLFSIHEGGDLDSPAVAVIIRLVDRVLYVLFGRYCLLPTTGAGRNAVLTNTSITNLNTLLTKENLGELIYHLCYALGGKSNSFNANTIAKPILETVLPLLVSADYVKPYRQNILNPGEITIGQLENFVDECNLENKCRFDYVPAEVNATTKGTYYTVNISLENGVYEAVATPVSLPNQYDPTVTYYTRKFVVANVDRFTESDSAHKYYTQSVSYRTVTLNGENYDPNATYCSAEFVEASVDATTNGFYFTSQHESSLVSLPENYSASATYYTHPEVVLGASDTGTYKEKLVSYNEVTLTGTTGSLIAGKKYYKPVQTTIEYDYMSAYDENTHHMSMGMYTSGDAAENGIGTYSTSISGTNFYIFREQEDFPDALYTYNNYINFIEEAADFVNDYKNFLLKDVPEAHDAWAAYIAGVNAGADANSNVPDDFYMHYNANGSYNSALIKEIENTIPYNNLQVIRDIKALYGNDYLNLFGAEPYESLTHGHGASNPDLKIGVYTGFTEWIDEVQKYSNGLNNYFDGINYYLGNSEQGRQSYTETSVTPLVWVLNLTAEVYNGGENKDADGNKIYTDKTYEAFRKAYVAAQDVVSQVGLNNRAFRTTQSMVTKTRNGLIDAYYALVLFGEKADLTQLYQYLVTARRIRNAEMDITGTPDATYTTDSFNAMCTMLNLATALYDTTPGSDEQSDVDIMASQLYTAINGLIYLEAPGIEAKEDVEEENAVDIGESWASGGIVYGYIYGVPEVLGYTFTGADDPSLKVKGIAQDGVKYSATSYGPGTGSSIVGKANGDATKFRYTVVLFGDLNGDARIDGSDKTAILAYAASTASNNMDAVQLTAADVNGDGAVNESDAASIQLVMEYKATINQAPNVIGTRVVMK